VCPDREEKLRQRNSSQQGELQAAEPWAGRERNLLPEMQWEGGFGCLLPSCAVQATSLEHPHVLLSHPAETPTLDVMDTR